jgi:hypothetical protein
MFVLCSVSVFLLFFTFSAGSYTVLSLLSVLYLSFYQESLAAVACNHVTTIMKYQTPKRSNEMTVPCKHT